MRVPLWDRPGKGGRSDPPGLTAWRKYSWTRRWSSGCPRRPARPVTLRRLRPSKAIWSWVRTCEEIAFLANLFLMPRGFSTISGKKRLLRRHGYSFRNPLVGGFVSFSDLFLLSRILFGRLNSAPPAKPYPELYVVTKTCPQCLNADFYNAS